MIIPKSIIDKKKTKQEWFDYFIQDYTIKSTNNLIFKEQDIEVKKFTVLSKENLNDLFIANSNIKKFTNVKEERKDNININNNSPKNKEYPLSESNFSIQINSVNNTIDNISYNREIFKDKILKNKHKFQRLKGTPQKYENLYKNCNDNNIQDIDITNFDLEANDNIQNKKKSKLLRQQSQPHLYPKCPSECVSVGSSFDKSQTLTNYSEILSIITAYGKKLSLRQTKNKRKLLSVDSFTNIFKPSSLTERQIKQSRSAVLQSEIPLKLFSDNKLYKKIYNYVHLPGN